MYRAALLQVLLLIANSVSAQPPAARINQRVDPGRFATQIWETKSNDDRLYRIFVSVPDGTPPSEGYSVMYVLDGNAYFGQAVESRNKLANQNEKAIIVGIGYPIDTRIDVVRRTYDLTPPADEVNLPPRRGGERWPTWGGADDFLSFVQNELKGDVEQRYSINRYRQALFGHSFGGLFALHAMFTRSSCFQTYIAASPSVWWNDYAIENARTELRSPVDLILTVGELELSSDVGPAAALAPTDAKRQFGTTKDFAASASGLGAKPKVDCATLLKKHRESPVERSYLRQKVDPQGYPRSGGRSYAKVALSS
ncbi:Ferri-bacillibactin esterase BesA [Stieleria maiorica]|uniref:Ferri-bacillibactin esterase BesA n=1 Tax=Stieleria maiorica TaxID=2795974 RepID=A0A5B9MG74_9BACT|nr:alpha/beta hydrolase-fold protein [Stieleria maiorica]QEF98595.1 Ferri-bacillibactin esterase BesA [Stieleria maiorica]